VYFILGADKELLYIGKAANLSRRLRDHARASDTSPIWRRIPSAVQEVKWVECASESEAACREADLIMALAPTFNKTMTVNDTFVYVGVERVSSSRGSKHRFRLTENRTAGGWREYGAFPQLGKGKVSWPAVRSNAGYAALLRLMWVAFSTSEMKSRLPSRLHGSSPPVDHTTPFDASADKLLHDFLSGRSPRLLGQLRACALSTETIAYMKPSLERDLVGAKEFFELGPRTLRDLRLRNSLAPGVIDRDTFSEMARRELQNEIGEFAVMPAKPDDHHLRRTARSTELRNARRRLAES
jgi:predicted GIY-YIG superfamily endonuclease